MSIFQRIQTALRGLKPRVLYDALVYTYRRTRAEARWGRPPTPARTWQEPGPVHQVTPTARGALLQAERATLELTFLAPDLVRITYTPLNDAPPLPLPYAIARPETEWEPVAVTVTTGENAVQLQTAALVVNVDTPTARLTLCDPAGQPLRRDRQVAFAVEGGVRHSTALAADERLFGLGEKATAWNRRGRRHTLWNTDPAGYAPGDEPINLNIPVYVGLIPGEGAPAAEGAAESGGAPLTYLVFYENPYRAELDLGAANPDVADHTFQGGLLRYYVIAGPVPHLLERYTELTGRHRLPPLWLLGYQQSRWSYYPEARVRQLAQDFREHDVPCDAIHLDIHYMDGYRCFTWDRERFPDPAQLAADLRAQGIKLVTIIDPGIKQDAAYPVYQSGLAADAFCKLPDGKPFIGPVWPGECAFPDFTAPAARAWWGEQYQSLLSAGVAGFWNDMNEPSVFSSAKDKTEVTMPGVVRHSLDGRGGDHREAHNLYGMQMVRASTEGLLRLKPEQRPVVITRAGWAGVQRYATSWTADNQSTWESYRLTIPLVLGLGLSGLAFTGSDTGGFIGTCDGELFTRWIQMSAFMPFFRAHTEINSPDQEPWSYGEPYLTIVRRFIELRYELLPYLYTAVWQMTARGWPLVRPLWWDAPEQRHLWDVDDAFLCGDALLVAPVLEPGATGRAVTLPNGSWYDFWTNALVRSEGTCCPHQVFAPLETLPLFVRAGTVLPLGEIGPSVEQRPTQFLRLHLYPLPCDGQAESWLYEDAGEGFGYEQGEYRLNRFVMRRAGDRLTVTWERTGAYTPPYEHVELAVHGLPRLPEELRADGESYAFAEIDPRRRMGRAGLAPFETVELLL